MKTKRVTIYLAEGVIKRLCEIQEATFASTPSEVLRVLVLDKHKRMFDSAQVIAKENKGESICDMLGGEMIEGVCHYSRYSVAGKDTVEESKMEIPGELLIEAMVSQQYAPSQKAVEKIQRRNERTI